MSKASPPALSVKFITPMARPLIEIGQLRNDEDLYPRSAGAGGNLVFATSETATARFCKDHIGDPPPIGSPVAGVLFAR